MKAKALCTILVPVVAVGGFILWPSSGKQSAATAAIPAPLAADASAKKVEAAPLEFVELHNAVEQGLLKAQFRGNGRNTVRATLTNTGAASLKVQTDAGQVLEAGKNAVVVLRSSMAEVAPGKSADVVLQTVAARSTNKVADATYVLSYQKVERLAPLLRYAQDHLELSISAAQTAALAITDNLPLNAVAKFTPGSGEVGSRFNTDAFRVETIDIVQALAVLRALNVPDDAVAMTIDPQLKIEAMIEPLSRAAAMRYYGITAQAEWDFWKTELLTGAPATRHYALYGIARFYPEIALEMLPAWARETKTNSVYRLSALQALADTQRIEALPLLRQLTDDLGAETELGRAARGAADYLDQRLNQLAARQTAIAFRASRNLSQF